jgi:hypothetical protein
MGTPKIGNICFGRSYVKGLIRLPTPPTRIIAFTFYLSSNCFKHQNQLRLVFETLVVGESSHTRILSAVSTSSK